MPPTFRSGKYNSILPEKISKKWQIVPKMVIFTLIATTYQYITISEILFRRLRTDKLQLRYNQLSEAYEKVYSDYLKFGVKLVRGYTGGVICTNKTGFKKSSPASEETSESTCRTL